MSVKSKKTGGAVGKGGVSPAPRAEDMTVRPAAEQLLMVPISDLVPYAKNARTHSSDQIELLRRSLREFGFVAPVLIDFENNIIAGHGRVEAARLEGMTEVPCVLVSNLSDAQRRAYILADNRLAELSGWDSDRLRLEMEQLADLRFDTVLIGFDMPAPPPLQFGSPEKKSGNKANQPDETEEYRQFVDKFKPKLTTDDCYTPENVYEVVKNWAVCRYSLEGAEVVRPFWPGGDYQSTDYSENCVVIDNPPFSIVSEICRFYIEKSIRFFLFAPGLTLLSIFSGVCNYVMTGASITYENGAVVNTSFVTNLGEYKIELQPELRQIIKDADEKNRNDKAKEVTGYVYPDAVLTNAAYRLAKYGQALRIRPEEAVFIRALDVQKEQRASIYGGGFLISERAAAERAAAERAAADRAAAERAAADRAAAERAAQIKLTLSERERELIKILGKENRNAGTETTDKCD